MSRPVIAYHIIFGAYGFWLPNDPRGSWSRYVGSNRLRPFGPPKPLNRDTALTLSEAEELGQMRARLDYPAVRFSDRQRESVATGFGEIIGKLGLVFYAAAIMPDHVHIVAARQEIYAEDIAGYLKRAASRRLRRDRLHPLSDYPLPNDRLPSPWAEHGWKVFLFDDVELEHAIEYVHDNPIEAGLPRQQWPWIAMFDQ
jgi:REP element-mobilizing transposase RayT